MPNTRREAIRERVVEKEKPDPTPLEVPLSCQRPPDLREEMRQFIRSEMSKQAEKEGQETFEEFDDFSIDDEEDDLTSEYTVQMTDIPDGYTIDQEVNTGSNQEPELPLEDGSNAPGAEGAEDTEPREVDKKDDSR